MQSCSSSLCILILLISTFTAVAESAIPSVKVNLHDSATLPCSDRCSGLVRWTVFHKPADVLAECDQTSCRSKEGYQMIHDQYLKGNHSLIITDADFSKRGWYTSDCDGKDFCDVKLQIEPLKTPIYIKPGESLDLDLDISDPVEVIYNNTGSANRSSGQICTVDGRSTQCKDEYTQRATLTSVLQLRRMTSSDSGVYTVMDSRNEETIHIYPVTVQGDCDDSEARRQADEARRHCSVPDDVQPCRDQRAALPGWVVPVLVVLLAVCAVSVGMNVRQRRENRQLQMRLEGGMDMLSTTRMS